MKILDIMNRPWAITSSKLEMICDVYARHEAGEKFDVEGLKAAAAGSSSGDDAGYTVQNGVAIIPIEGILSKRMNMLTYFSGGTSTEILQQTVNEAAADPAVHSIILSIDSPGGEVDGVQVAGQAISRAAETKPVIAFVDGMADSGAYWLAAQADAIYIASDTTEVGSIGVVFSHVDRSKANEMSGRKVTHVTAGKYKRIASADSPLSVEGQQSIQGQVDYLYSVFVDAVASGRGMDVDDVTATEAQVYFGQQAIQAGLADGVSSIDALVAQLNSPNPPKKGAISMAFKVFETESDYKAVLDAEFQRGQAAATPTAPSIEQIKTDARAEGATAERERIKAVESTPLAAAHPTVIAAMKYDGKSTASEAAVAILAAEEKVRGDKAAALAADAGTGVAASAGDPKTEAAQQQAAAASAEATEDPKALAVKIEAHKTAAEKDGRKLSFAQAAAEVAAKK